MDKKKMIYAGLGVSLIGGAIWFGYRLWKEIRNQQQMMVDELKEEIDDLLGDIDAYEEAVAYQKAVADEYKEQLRIQNQSLTTTENGVEFVPNPEFEEMKARYSKKVTHIFGKKNETIVENAWDTNPSYPIGRKDIPLSVIEDDYRKIMERDEDYQAVKKEEEEKKGVNMRYDPNSVEAFESYKSMYYIDIFTETVVSIESFKQRYGFPDSLMQHDSEDVVDILNVLFDYPVEPSNDMDHSLFDNIYDRRNRFFGESSIYSNSASFAEVLLEIVDRVDANVYDLSQTLLLVYIFENLGLFSANLDDDDKLYTEYIEPVILHTFLRNGSFGVFGLDDDSLIGEESNFHQQINEFVGRLMSYHGMEASE